MMNVYASLSCISYFESVKCVYVFMNAAFISLMYSGFK